MTTTSPDEALTPTCWLEPPSEAEDGAVLCRALTGVALLTTDPAAPAEPSSSRSADGEAEGEDTTGEETSLAAAVDLLVQLFAAERGFLFSVDEDAPEGGSVLDECLIARDVDGDDVPQAVRKVPTELLDEAARRRTVVCGDAERAEIASFEPERVQSLTLPIEWRGNLRALCYFENRFRPLSSDRATLRLAEFHAHVLATLLELARIRRENRSLWLDLKRLRKNHPDERRLPAAPRASDAPDRDRSSLKGDYSMIVGSSPRMLEIFRVLDRISSSNAPVLINGESGTGKELIAQAVHSNSPRRDQVFVSENCGALTETLLESELFGYVRGAFTGANKDSKGLFELAVGGTLFLDEVGDMSAGMQKKLLRVLQEGVIRRVGGKDYVPVDVRIISATNKDLLAEVQAGNFREDLYYRLNVINLKLPPLRDRKDDIPAIIDFFLGELAKDGVRKTLEPATLEHMVSYDWPGNIRELQNEVRRMHAMADSSISPSDLSETLLSERRTDGSFLDVEKEFSNMTLREATEHLEKEMIRRSLRQCRGNKSLVAKLLRVPKTSLYNKINKYGLDDRRSP